MNQLAMQVFGCDSRERYGQYFLGLDAILKKARNTPFHGKRLSSPRTGYDAHSLRSRCGNLKRRTFRVYSIAPSHIAPQISVHSECARIRGTSLTCLAKIEKPEPMDADWYPL
jgi:hypothetical protein